MSQAGLDFAGLVEAIADLQNHLQRQATRAVNTALTLRNWAIGAHIVLFEQEGTDRADYGLRLLDVLSERLSMAGMRGVAARSLRQHRQFYLTYPDIWQTLPAESRRALARLQIWQTLPAKSQIGAEEGRPAMEVSGTTVATAASLTSLSFAHFAELIGIDEPLKRAFYEIEAVRGQWSVRELHRQIVTLAFERTALSTDKAALLAQLRSGAEADSPALVIRDPYVFEFLGIKPAEVMGESRLEDALLDKVQAFLLELGRGFCFEARQKRILIGDEHFFVDLVFYHRILKCHVLVELKVDEFRHEHLGQLNTYVNWFRVHEMSAGDNPPVGLLLCTRRKRALLEYALAGLDNQLFVSRYQLELPRKEELEALLEAELRERGVGEAEA